MRQLYLIGGLFGRPYQPLTAAGLIVVFLVAIGLSVYFVKEAFTDISTADPVTSTQKCLGSSDLPTGVSDPNGLVLPTINSGSNNDTADISNNTVSTSTTGPNSGSSIQNHIDDLITALSTNQVNTNSQPSAADTPPAPSGQDISSTTAPLSTNQVNTNSQPSAADTPPAPSGQDISSTTAPLSTNQVNTNSLSSYYDILGASTGQMAQPPTVTPKQYYVERSPSLAQGADWHKECPKMPDMTQYIRKDSIPCWGCTVEY